MPSFEEHCSKCRLLLGASFPQVHLWLDEFYQKAPWGTRHRHLRHNQEGIEEIRRMWGDEAARAAEVHIRQDLHTEGWPEDKPIPKNSNDFIEAGLW